MTYQIVINRGQIVIETINESDEIIQIRSFDKLMNDSKSSIIAKQIRDFAGIC